MCATLEPKQVEAAPAARLVRGPVGKPPEEPVVSDWLLRLFLLYVRHYLPRHFHAVRLSREPRPALAGEPNLVVYLNHSSWWDPLVCMLVKDRLFPEYTAFAPIDESALSRYQFLARLGLFGLEPGTVRGAAKWLRTAGAILSRRQTMLWITPQGRVADARERPMRFQAGLGHLARRVERAAFVPLAIEYVFWTERLPEILLRFGEPLRGEQGRTAGWDAGDWTRRFERELEVAQESLARQARARDQGSFEILLSGRRGVGGIYDWWRRGRAYLRGEQFNPEHASA